MSKTETAPNGKPTAGLVNRLPADPPARPEGVPTELCWDLQGKVWDLYDPRERNLRPITLPAGAYMVQIVPPPMGPRFVLEERDGFTAPPKLYGDVDAQARRIISTFDSRPANTGVLLEGVKGCLAGDAVIGLNRAGKGFSLPIRDVVHRFNGGTTKGKKWDPDIPTMVRAFVDGSIRLHALRAAYPSGVKPVVRLTTRGGKTILATPDHKFLTANGWACLGDVREGDAIYADCGQGGGPRREKNIYPQASGLWGHPYRNRTTGTGIHRLVIEAEMNGLPLDEFIARLKANKDCHLLKFLDPKVWHVHHVDENVKNYARTNLEVLPRLDHLAHHGKKDGWRNVNYRAEPDPVVLVRSEGAQETYDLAMDGEPHNFLANGLVVHNSGKTLLARVICQRLIARGLPVLMVTQPFAGDLFSQFIASIKQPKVILIDEFEKVYPGSSWSLQNNDDDADTKKVDGGNQKYLLSLLDGVYPSKTLWLLTANDKYKVDRNMHNRPGRLYYSLSFNGLDGAFVRQYAKDNLKDQAHVEKLVRMVNFFTDLTFDQLQGLVEEMNRYDESPAQALKYLNVRADRDTASYRVKIAPVKPKKGFAPVMYNPYRTVTVDVWGSEWMIAWFKTKADEKASRNVQRTEFSPDSLHKSQPDRGVFVFRDADDNIEVTLTETFGGRNARPDAGYDRIAFD